MPFWVTQWRTHIRGRSTTLVVWNFLWHRRKRSCASVCQQTSPKQKETRISCWRSKKWLMSRTSQLNLTLASALARKQDLLTNHRRIAPAPVDGHFFAAAKFKRSSETSHWTLPLNMKMASWSISPSGHMFHFTEFSTMLSSTLCFSTFQAAFRTKPSLLTCVSTDHIIMFQPHTQVAFLPKALGSHVFLGSCTHSFCHLGENNDSKGSHCYLSHDYVPDRC